MGYSPWGHKESDTTEQLYTHYLANKVRLVKARVFPVAMYGWDSWSIKKAER